MSLIPLMTLHGDVADQYNAILQTVKDVPEIPFDALVAGHRDVYSGGSGARFCHRDMFFGKMGQAINLESFDLE